MKKIVHTEAMIAQLGLTKCIARTALWEAHKGIFTGEQKRVSIRQGMLINFSLLFMDEPTSSLVSTAKQIVFRPGVGSSKTVG